uniref:Putative proteasome assembly chaperone n=1 Tax=Ixodes ricinus TaxID=34613 RepID=A0A131YA99_IXORI
MEPARTTQLEPQFSTHEFSRKFGEAVVHFLVLKMNKSFFLWIGSRRANLSNIAVAMKTAYDKVPTSTGLLGDPSDLTSTSLASKLASRTGCQVFVSCNLADPDKATVNFVHECLAEEMTLFPNKFY